MQCSMVCLISCPIWMIFIIIGSIVEEHLATLMTVLEQFWSHGFRLTQQKFYFLQPSVEYLGHDKCPGSTHNWRQMAGCCRYSSTNQHSRVSLLFRSCKLLQLVYLEFSYQVVTIESVAPQGKDMGVDSGVYKGSSGMVWFGPGSHLRALTKLVTRLVADFWWISVLPSFSLQWYIDTPAVSEVSSRAWIYPMLIK